MDVRELLDLYRATLLDDVIPFWMRHGIDPSGAFNTCIADDGRVQSRDRWSWSQWRAVYVFSKLYTRIEPREEWLNAARGICNFMTAHGPLPDGPWPLLLDGDGQVLRGPESIYADGFAVYALVELWRATREAAVLDLAVRTFRAMQTTLHADGPPPAWPYPIAPGRINHGVSMICSQVFDELADATGSDEIRCAADSHHRRVMDQFLRADRGVVLEWLSDDGKELPPPEGTVIVPGHAIESMWFQMHIARVRGDTRTLDRCAEAIRQHLELGWDEAFGGLFLAVDADGRSDVAWNFADHKLWWPHTEALYATLLAHEHCGQAWCLAWHERLREYCWRHFPVPEHGEWRQKLDRQGRPITEVVALPVKDPYHLPRALIYCIDVLERLVDSAEA